MVEGTGTGEEEGNGGGMGGRRMQLEAQHCGLRKKLQETFEQHAGSGQVKSVLDISKVRILQMLDGTLPVNRLLSTCARSKRESEEVSE